MSKEHDDGATPPSDSGLSNNDAHITGRPQVVSSAPPHGAVFQRQGSVEFRASRGLMTDPRSLAEYEEAIPGAGGKILERYLEQTEKERVHRHAMERTMIEHAFAENERLMRQGDRAQWFALASVLTGVGLAAYAFSTGHPQSAVAIIATVFGSAATSFIYGRKKQADEMLAAQQEPNAGPPLSETKKRAPGLPPRSK